MLTQLGMRNKPKNAVTLNLYLQSVKRATMVYGQTFLYVHMLYEAAFNGSIKVHE